MLILENGKPYPDARYRQAEGLTIVPTETSFFLLAIVPDLTEAEIEAWGKGNLRYGIVSTGGIPFILLDFPEVKMTLDAPFNSMKIDTELRRNWIIEVDKANLLHLVLVEKKTFMVQAQRAIGMVPDLSISLKAAAMAQAMSGISAQAIDARIQSILRTLTTADLIDAGKMYTL